MSFDLLFDYEKPRPPRDRYAVRLRERFGLRPNPSLREIESVAKDLLVDPDKILEGMEIVLGRIVTAKDLEDVKTCLEANSPERAFLHLLNLLNIETYEES